MDFDLNSYSMDAPINPNWDSMYKMTSQPRGYCLIINNRYFMGEKKKWGVFSERLDQFLLDWYQHFEEELVARG